MRSIAGRRGSRCAGGRRALTIAIATALTLRAFAARTGRTVCAHRSLGTTGLIAAAAHPLTIAARTAAVCALAAAFAEAALAFAGHAVWPTGRGTAGAIE